MSSFIRNLDIATDDLKDMYITLAVFSPAMCVLLFAFAYWLFSH